MAEDCCDFHKDALIIKAPRKSPLALRMTVLAFVMVCGVYICSICLKQSTINSQPQINHVGIIKKHCYNPNIPASSLKWIHYPIPSNYSREECACNPVRFFAIMSMQRSGSGWFETLLNSHINISSNGEVFGPSRRTNISTIIQTLDQVYNLDFISSAAKNTCTAAVGLKWMLNQGLMEHHKEIAKYFSRRGVSAIFLFRRNLLRRLVSLIANSHDSQFKLLNGTHKSHVHSEDEAGVLASFRPKINTTSLVSTLKNTEGSVIHALKSFSSIRHIILFYEDLITNKTKLADEVQDFLGVPRHKLVSRQVKIHKKPLSEQVENWDDVYKTLKGTQYEGFLNADYQL